MEDASLHDLFKNYLEDRETTLFLAALDYILDNYVSFVNFQCLYALIKLEVAY